MGQRRFAAEKPIVLVGLPGAGKTTVGRRLAAQLSLPFADGDEEVEREAGFSVREIFDRFGETGFRERERKVMARLAAGRAQVIAAGGGAFVDPTTRKLILDACNAVWLDVDVSVAAQRIGKHGNRPLLYGEQVHDALAKLAALRASAYAQAHVRISGAGSPDEVANAIVEALVEQVA